MALASLGIGLAVAVGMIIKSFSGQHLFAPGACERLLPYLQSHVVGQDLALTQLTNAICDHLEASGEPSSGVSIWGTKSSSSSGLSGTEQQQQQAPQRPLVMSVHGPPGVGKSLTHYLLARALYSKDPESVTDCPGSQCAGYKVLYGMDYVSGRREEQHSLLRAALVEHVGRAPESLLVVEEYDKLDCPTRAMFRQLLENPAVANLSGMGRSIVLLESNTGYTQLHKLLLQAGDRAKVSPEEATRALKDTVFVRWLASGCEDRADTSKLMGLVSFFLPYFPLEADHVRELFEKRLAARAQALAADRGLALEWDDALPGFLASKVDFDGGYPIEGAKEVGTLITRYVSAALRRWDAANRAKVLQQQNPKEGPPLALRLRLGLPGTEGTELTVDERVDALEGGDDGQLEGPARGPDGVRESAAVLR